MSRRRLWYIVSMKTEAFAAKSGHLMEFVTGSGPVSLCYLKVSAYESLPVPILRPTLLMPRGAGSFEVKCHRAKKNFVIDATANLFLPERESITLVGPDVTSELLILGATATHLGGVAHEYQISAKDLRAQMARVIRFPRTLWMSEVGHRYYFERCMCRKSDTLATRFLEAEIFKEIYYAVKEGHKAQGQVPALFNQQTIAKKAVNFIETRLFDALALDGIAKAAATSRAGLVRAFKKEIGKSPFEYIQDRRLQEALSRLRTGAYSVTEVAHAVGYESGSAFSQAFRRKYRQAPSDYLRQHKL